MERKAISIRPKQAEKLKEKSFKVSMELKKVINESDLVHHLIDRHLRDVDAENIKK